MVWQSRSFCQHLEFSTVESRKIRHVSLRSLEFFLEPFPEPRIIEPYSDHHHTKYKSSTKIHGYSSFPMHILQSGVIHRTSSSMSYFGIQMENAFAYEISMKCIFFCGNSYNPPGYLPNSRDGRNHLLVISRMFGLLSARAWIHRANQLETSQEGQRALCPADGHDLVLQRLAQHFEHAHPEFGQFVQK